MRKIVLLFLEIVLLCGCTNGKERELCDVIEKIDVNGFVNDNNYEELTSILESNYKRYCTNLDSSVCVALNNYVNASKQEIVLKDCNSEGKYQNICEYNNKLTILGKKNNVTYMHEEMWAVCNK